MEDWLAPALLLRRRLDGHDEGMQPMGEPMPSGADEHQHHMMPVSQQRKARDWAGLGQAA